MEKLTDRPVDRQVDVELFVVVGCSLLFVVVALALLWEPLGMEWWHVLLGGFLAAVVVVV